MFLTFSKEKYPPVFPENRFVLSGILSRKLGGNIMTIRY